MPISLPLPFGPDAYTPGKDNHSVKVYQGFGGSFSHKETDSGGVFYYAVDFALGFGAPVLSQGNGEVIAMVENIPDGGPKSLSDDSSWGTSGIGNYVTVKYNGGTPEKFYATYQHLRQDGVEVNVGDTITAHQLLGYVGNTGYRDGTHLHVTYGKTTIEWVAGTITDGSRAKNHSTEPVLFAVDSDNILDSGKYYQGDNVVDGPGNDILIGDKGNNELHGGAGIDVLAGGPGNDTLDGGDGNDTLSGHDGNDKLDGGLGDHVMTGGPGADQFMVLGNDKILDFNPKEDSIWLPWGNISGISVGKDTVVTYPGGKLTLVNTKPTDVPGLSSERLFSETEQNNSREHANDLGKLFPNQKIHITGHLNGNSDSYDYFDYVATEAGTISIKMYRGSEIIYDETFIARQANEPFYYYGWAEGNADFNYDTYISLSPATAQDILIA